MPTWWPGRPTPASGLVSITIPNAGKRASSASPDISPSESLEIGDLINTPLQRGVRGGTGIFNRFNGFYSARETVETVDAKVEPPITPLKRGVNES
ncbi:MAG: hypothetical protein NTW03_10395, partial [Verrucomicrobia bacterium]|nr:hypothetical protein [Verrucomicrobiota bacterium]